MVTTPKLVVKPLAVTESKTCKVCGRPLPDRTGKPGRPTDFCSPINGEEVSTCGRLDKRFHEVRKLACRMVEEIEADGGDATEVKRRLQKLKSFLWSEANTATNKGKLVGQIGTKRYGKTRSGWWRLAPDVGRRGSKNGKGRTLVMTKTVRVLP